MDQIEFLEIIIHWLGGLTAFSTHAILLYGIWRGTQQKAGRVTGFNNSWLRSPWFYLALTAMFFGICYFGWTSLSLNISQQIRAWMLVLGSLLYFPGMSLVLWGRLALGKNYFVSTGFGAQLFADHQLVTTGPYTVVRHPMYLGLVLAAWGALLIYFTWTTVYFSCFAPLLAFRAYREEQALSAEFGEQWQEYCKHVPAFFPRLRKAGTHG